MRKQLGVCKNKNKNKKHEKEKTTTTTAKIQGTKLGYRKAKRFKMLAFEFDIFLLIKTHPPIQMCAPPLLSGDRVETG